MKKSVRNRQQNLNSNSNSLSNTPNKEIHNSKLLKVSHLHCINHQGKIATHQFNTEESQQIFYYCQKCSIMLASQGFNVQRISNQTSQSQPKNRLKQIKCFLKTLQQNVKVLSDRYCEVEEYLMESEDWYGSLTEKIENYFQNLSEVLELQKYMCYNNLLNKRAATEKEIRVLRENLKSTIVQIQGMSDDIQNNLDAVEGVDYSIYSSIINGYQQKLNAVPNLLNNDYRPLIKFQLTIPEVPNALYTIVDKIYHRGTPNPPTPFKSSFFSNSQSRRDTETHKQLNNGNNNKYCSQTNNYNIAIKKQIEKVGQLGFSFDSKQNASNVQLSNYDEKSQKQKQILIESLDGYLNQETIGNESYEDKMEDTDTLLIA